MDFPINIEGRSPRELLEILHLIRSEIERRYRAARCKDTKMDILREIAHLDQSIAAYTEAIEP